MVDDSTDYWQAGLNNTVASAHSVPQYRDVEHNEIGAPGLARASQTDITYANGARRPLKRKGRQSPSKFPQFLVANCISNSL
jgi:hypothetical protein